MPIKLDEVVAGDSQVRLPSQWLIWSQLSVLLCVVCSHPPSSVAAPEGSVSNTPALCDVSNGALGRVMVLDPGAAGCILRAPLRELQEASKWTNLSLAVTSGSARPCVDGGLSQLSAPDKTYLIDLKSVQRTTRRGDVFVDSKSQKRFR